LEVEKLISKINVSEVEKGRNGIRLKVEKVVSGSMWVILRRVEVE
jgi:hypothetical protein